MLTIQGKDPQYIKLDEYLDTLEWSRVDPFDIEEERQQRLADSGGMDDEI